MHGFANMKPTCVVDDGTLNERVVRIAIFYPCDPLGFVPSGIESFIRGILKRAPEDLHYTLFGATTEASVRPLAREILIPGLHHESRFVPLVAMDPSARRSRIPLTLRYMWALRKYIRRESITRFDILDFHRLEPIVLFRNDPRPMNLVLHQDMSVIRGKYSDIKWRHLPWLYERFEKNMFRHVRHVFCVRQSAVDRYRTNCPDAATKFEFIPTWVDIETFAPTVDSEVRDKLRSQVRAELELPVGARLLVFVGRLDRQKDPVLLVDAFAAARMRESNLHLIIVGDGALRPKVEKKIHAGGMASHVSLLGVLPARRIAGFLQASDLFLLSSAYEGMPIAVLEALATGLPVVSTDVGEIRLVLKDGVNGAVSKAHTPEAMAEAIAATLARLDSLRGSPCTDSVAQYGPAAVLERLYQHHRQQAKNNNA